jgi:outer membrane protein assembly factor BamB
MFNSIVAFALDANARLLSGWPVDLPGTYFTGRVVGDELMLFTQRPLGDVIEEGQPTDEAELMIVGADGAVRSGVQVTCCAQIWAVGPDGVAYGVASASMDPSPQEWLSSITALDLSGVRAGWPITMDDIASGPAFGPDGRIALTSASSGQRTSRILLVDRDRVAVSAISAAIPIATVDEAHFSDTGGCVTFIPETPLLAPDGTIVVYSDLVSAVYALDPSLKIAPGWPFEPVMPLVRARPGFESEHEAGYCPAPVRPAIGSDGTLYLPLEARDETIGGSLVAVGQDGRVRPGWPVELRRPGSEFWSVMVGSDGTAYALAIEPEANGTSSATLLAIASDSTVLWTTTVVEP